MPEKRQYYRQETTGMRYPVGDLYGYPDSLIRGRTGAAYKYGLPLLGNPSRVLDFGSGRGHGVKAINDQLHRATIVSAEKYFPYLQAQQTTLSPDGKPTPYNFVNVKGDLPFADRSFDAVSIMHVIEHITDPKKLMADLHRVLSDDGKLLMATPDMKNLVGNSPYDEHVFTRDELETLLVDSGFNPEFYYVVPNERASKVHKRKKWFGTHAPFTANIRNHVNPKLWDAAVFRSGISARPLEIDDFHLSQDYDPKAIDLLVVASKVK